MRLCSFMPCRPLKAWYPDGSLEKGLPLFSGFLRRADCEKTVTWSQIGKNYRYLCSTYKNQSRTACSQHAIKHEKLEAAVPFVVRQQVHLAASYSKIVARINSAPIKKASLSDWTIWSQQRIGNWRKSSAISSHFIKTGKVGNLPRRTTGIWKLIMNGNCIPFRHTCPVEFRASGTGKRRWQRTSRSGRLYETPEYWSTHPGNFYWTCGLHQGLENGNISVRFKFADELRKIAEYIEINTTEDPAVAGWGPLHTFLTACILTKKHSHKLC